MKLNLQDFKGMCECQNFVFTGILCRHFLKVFIRLHIDSIPDHFILSRRKEQANNFKVIDSEGLVKNDGIQKSKTLRLTHMCRQDTKLACIAASSNEAYTTYMDTINDLSKRLSEVLKHSTSASPKKGDSCSNNIRSSHSKKKKSLF